MKRIAAAALFAPALLLISGLARAVTDDLGREIDPVGPGKRIVALAPFLAEAAALVVGRDLVGVSEHSDDPPRLRELPVVSGSAGIHWERLLALRPDLALAWKDALRPADLERFRALGIPVFVAAGRRLADVGRVYERLGELTGRDAGREARAAIERDIASIRAGWARRDPIAVFVEIWHQPLTTIAGEHYINDAIELCGAVNAFKDLRGVAPQVSWEALYARDPTLIVGAGSASDEAQFRKQWNGRPLAAVRGGALVFIPADDIQRPSRRILRELPRTCAAIHARADAAR